MRHALTSILVLLIAISSTGCFYAASVVSGVTFHESRAGEAVLFKTPNVEVRVVRTRQSDVFGTLFGYSYSVQCGANGTWTTITGGSDSVSPSAEAIAKTLRTQFQIFGDDMLVWTPGRPILYADRCTSVRTWNPASVDESLIEPAPIWPQEQEPAPLEAKPWFCAQPERKAECRSLEFGGERRVHYSNTKVDPNGTIAFDAMSTAFKSGTLHVVSHDWGRSWSYTP